MPNIGATQNNYAVIHTTKTNQNFCYVQENVYSTKAKTMTLAEARELKHRLQSVNPKESYRIVKIVECQQ